MTQGSPGSHPEARPAAATEGPTPCPLTCKASRREYEAADLRRPPHLCEAPAVEPHEVVRGAGGQAAYEDAAQLQGGRPGAGWRGRRGGGAALVARLPTHENATQL